MQRTKAILEDELKRTREALDHTRRLLDVYQQEATLLRTTSPIGIIGELTKCIQSTAKMVRTVAWAHRPDKKRDF